MPSSLTALGLAVALTFGGSSFALPQRDDDANAPTVVEDRDSAGAYLVAVLALVGLAGLAGITHRDYVRAHRHTRRRRQPVESPPPSTGAETHRIGQPDVRARSETRSVNDT